MAVLSALAIAAAGCVLTWEVAGRYFLHIPSDWQDELSAILLIGTIQPSLQNTDFLVAMGVLGIGMGLIVSQLGNVAQSAVGDRDRSEAGGLQYTAQQLGSSLGTAVLGRRR